MADNEDASVSPEAPPPATVGETLRAARVAQDLTVEQLAAELRIEARQLTALEEDRFERIGVPVFVKGYIRQYGQRFGLNIADLLALYYRQGKVADIEIRPNRTIKLRDDRQISSWIVAGLVLATLVVGFAAWWWNGGTFEMRGATATVSAASTAAGAPAAPAPAPSSGVAPRVEPISAPSPVPVTAAAASAAPEPAAVGGAEAAAAPPTPETAAAAVTIPLEFRFAAESWAEVSDARGERLLFGLNAAGRQVTVRGEPPFSIVLGNADSVELRVDGAPYAIPTTGRQGNLARFSIDTAEE